MYRMYGTRNVCSARTWWSNHLAFSTTRKQEHMSQLNVRKEVRTGPICDLSQPVRNGLFTFLNPPADDVFRKVNNLR